MTANRCRVSFWGNENVLSLYSSCTGLPRWLSGIESTCQSRKMQDTRWERSPGGGNSNPLQYSGLDNPTDRASWQATVHGVLKSQTWATNTFTLFRYYKQPGNDLNYTGGLYTLYANTFSRRDLSICGFRYTQWRGQSSNQSPENTEGGLWWNDLLPNNVRWF